MFTKVCDNVYLVGGEGYSSSGDCCVYLIEGREDILIDAGSGRNPERIVDNISEAGILSNNIKYLLLTHCHIDHIGGANYFAQHFRLKIVAHKSDAGAISTGDQILTAALWYNIKASPVNIDIKLKGDSGTIENIETRIEWLHIPGHTPGSIAFILRDKKNTILFGQDIHGPLSKEFGSNKDDYKKSLLKLIDLDADILCEGHYGVIKGRENIKNFIKQFIMEE